MSKTLLIGKRIKAQRLLQNLSRQQLADQLGVKYETIRKWEDGGGIPRPTRYMDLCSALSCDESYLILGIIRKRGSA